MPRKHCRIAVSLFLVMAGCTAGPARDDVQDRSTAPLGYGPDPSISRYTEPQASGLVGVRPYPRPDDVCKVIGENAVTRDLPADGSLLIGCPKHERGAIGDRMAEGATVVAHARHWTLLSAGLPRDDGRNPSAPGSAVLLNSPVSDLRPYPGPDDVCRALTRSTAARGLLIMCPTRERGAISDRMAEGAKVWDADRDWTILSVPD